MAKGQTDSERPESVCPFFLNRFNSILPYSSLHLQNFGEMQKDESCDLNARAHGIENSLFSLGYPSGLPLAFNKALSPPTIPTAMNIRLKPSAVFFQQKGKQV